MRVASLFTSLSLLAAVQAITVTYPTTGATWSPQGPNALTWSSVSSDPTDFEVVLVNPNFSVTQVLIAQQNTADGKASVQAPSGGFPLGSMWRVNLMSIATTGQSSGILAQSGYFNITTATSSTGTTSGTASASLPTTMTGMTATTTAGSVSTPAGAGTDGVTSTSEASLNPTGVSSASGFFQVSSGLLAVVAAVHAFAL